MKYRYYVGLQLPPEMSTMISAVQRDLFDPIESVEPLEPHITLLPPPAVEDLSPEDLAMHLKEAAHNFWPLTIRLTEVVTFQGHAVAIRAESNALHDLQQKLVDVLPFQKEVRYFPIARFTPHVTLVSALRGHTLPSHLVEKYRDELSALLPTTFKAQHLTLFEWLGPRKYEARSLRD